MKCFATANNKQFGTGMTKPQPCRSRTIGMCRAPRQQTAGLTLEALVAAPSPRKTNFPAVTYMCYKCCRHGLHDVSSVLVAIVGFRLAKKTQSGGAELSGRRDS